MIERMGYWIMRRKKSCRHCCLWCRHYSVCRSEIVGMGGTQSGKKGEGSVYGNLKRGEDTEQMGVIDWANWNTGRFPELKLLFHIPNGGKRDAKEAARFKAMGVKAGVPDLCLPTPKNGYAGLYIEMKYGKNKPTDNQKGWIKALKEQGYKVAVCYSGIEATQELESYLQGPRTVLVDPESECLLKKDWQTLTQGKREQGGRV